jgi:hypothetical protein
MAAVQERGDEDNEATRIESRRFFCKQKILCQDILVQNVDYVVEKELSSLLKGRVAKPKNALFSEGQLPQGTPNLGVNSLVTESI